MEDVDEEETEEPEGVIHETMFTFEAFEMVSAPHYRRLFVD